MAMAADCIAFLDGLGVAEEDVDLFEGPPAAIPDGGPWLEITGTTGAGFSLTHNDTATELASAQVFVRGPVPSEAWDLIKAAFDAFGGANGKWNVTVNGTFYLMLRARQGISEDIGLDASGRTCYAFNLEAEKAPA